MRRNSENAPELAVRKRPLTQCGIVISNCCRDKSLVDDLTGTEYCKYVSRPVLRTTEIQLVFYDLFIKPPCLLSSAGVVNSF